MGLFGRLFAANQKLDSVELLPAIERAVSRVEPLLKQAKGYPEAYRKPVINALEYARSLAQSVPGPVSVNLDSYARDAYVHAIFPSKENVSEAFKTSLELQEYLRKSYSGEEIFALMGMRRREKTILGMELAGQVIQQDVPQQVVYFISHTIENPAPSEELARQLMAWSFFDSLVDKVAQKIAERKQNLQAQRQELDALRDSLRGANELERPALEAKLSNLLASLPATADSLDLSNYVEDFAEVMLKPENYLRLNQTPMTLDSMGIKRNSNAATPGEELVFNELIGFDRRDWTVIMVHCSNIQSETFAERLDSAYRMLSI
ncbi:MAG: hypothetical protein WC742_05640 [Gallionellaceae bacterium]|jgi:hypothetical protein